MAATRPRIINENRVYDPNTLSWVAMEQPVIQGETINVAIGGSVAVTGPLTDAQLRAAPVVITGAVVVL